MLSEVFAESSVWWFLGLPLPAVCVNGACAVSSLGLPEGKVRMPWCVCREIRILQNPGGFLWSSSLNTEWIQLQAFLPQAPNYYIVSSSHFRILLEDFINFKVNIDHGAILEGIYFLSK